MEMSNSFCGMVVRICIHFGGAVGVVYCVRHESRNESDKLYFTFKSIGASRGSDGWTYSPRDANCSRHAGKLCYILLQMFYIFIILLFKSERLSLHMVVMFFRKN